MAAPDAEQDDQIGEVPHGTHLEVVDRHLADQLDPVIQRRERGDDLAPQRELIDREERSGEQEQRRHDEPEQPRVGLVGDERRGEGHHQRRAANTGKHGDRDRYDRQRRREHAEQRHDQEECRCHLGEAERDRHELAEVDVLDGQRRREDGLVVPLPGHLAHDRVGGVEDPGLHATRGEHPRGEEVDEAGSAERSALLDHRSEAEPHRGEEHHRGQNGGEEREPPRPPHDQKVPADHFRRVHSIRDLPVIVRKTSSSDARRTSAVSVSIPLSWTAAKASSPECV